MVTTATVNDPDTKLWNQQLAELQARFKHIRPASIAALCVMQQDPDVSVDDAKARAAARGIKITIASLNAARRLFERQDGAPAAETPARDVTPATTRKRQRRASTAANGGSHENLIRGLVTKLEAQANAEAERLRGAMRKAIEVLQHAAG